MKLSKLFTKTRKEVPADEVAKNAQLLIQAGFIHKEMAGVYSLLPLGLIVIDKIQQIIKEEMDELGGIEMKTSALQTKEVWEKTDRWSDKVVDNWFKTKLHNGNELGLSFTNEEAYSNIMKNYITSYKDLPVYAYDFKTIFRNEIRSKSGIMRGREFYWKALYSFSKDKAEHDEFYEKAKLAYETIFNRVGIGDSTHFTFASGGSFAKYSHEFQTVSDAGEDTIYIDESTGIAINKEVLTDQVLEDLKLEREQLTEKKAIEVGNIFSLCDKFSKPFQLTYTDEEGKEQQLFMGSYGIGLTRLMGTVVETLADDNGIVWPESIAPAQVYLVQIGDDEGVANAAQDLYKELQDKNIEVLHDDRDVRPGEKFADADLMGIPHRVVVSPKTLKEQKFEYKKRTEKEAKLTDKEELLKALASSK